MLQSKIGNLSNHIQDERDKFKLCFVFWSTPRFGGMERRYARLAAYLMSVFEPGEIVVITQRRCLDELKKYFDKEMWPFLIEFGTNYSSTGNNFFRVFRELRDFRSVLVSNYAKRFHLCMNPGIISFFFSVFLGKASVKTLAMADTNYESNSTMISRFLAGISLKKFKRVDCLSEHTKELLVRFFSKNYSKKYRIAPCSFSDYSDVAQQDIRDLDVVMMARFVDGKGYELLEEIADIFEQIDLYCFGFGPKPPRINSAVVSFSDNPYLSLGRTKIFLSLQRKNNYPSQSVLEAMASGCAIIATDVGETRKFLDDKCAVLIPYDGHALEQAIKSLLNDENRRQSLGSQAREKVFKEHTIDLYASYFLEDIVELHL